MVSPEFQLHIEDLVSASSESYFSSLRSCEIVREASLVLLPTGKHSVPFVLCHGRGRVSLGSVQTTLSQLTSSRLCQAFEEKEQRKVTPLICQKKAFGGQCLYVQRLTC